MESFLSSNDGKESLPPLTVTAEEILTFMAKAPQRLFHIGEVVTWLNRPNQATTWMRRNRIRSSHGTVQKEMKYLESIGYIDRPRTERLGRRITKRGEQAAALFGP